MQNSARLLQELSAVGHTLKSKKAVVAFLVDFGISPATNGFDALVDKIMQKYMIGKYQKRLGQLVLDYNELKSFRKCYLKAKEAYDYSTANNVKVQQLLAGSFYKLEKYITQLATKYLDKYGFKVNKNYVREGEVPNVLNLIDSFADNYKVIIGSYE